jgi:hypothetical protein
LGDVRSHDRTSADGASIVQSNAGQDCGVRVNGHHVSEGYLAAKEDECPDVACVSYSNIVTNRNVGCDHGIRADAQVARDGAKGTDQTSLPNAGAEANARRRLN